MRSPASRGQAVENLPIRDSFLLSAKSGRDRDAGLARRGAAGVFRRFADVTLFLIPDDHVLVRVDRVLRPILAAL